MKQLCDAILSTLQGGDGLVLLSVVQRRGSAPRGLGAAMLLLKNGESLGTIGGGTVEYTSMQAADELFLSQDSRVLAFRLSGSEIADAGMICGGSLSVLLHYIAPSNENIRLFSDLTAARDAGREAALLRCIAGGRVVRTGWWDGETVHGMDGIRLSACGAQAYYDEAAGLLYEPVMLPTRCLLFGGGHVAQKLAPLIDTVDFRCTVLEDRAGFLSPALFPSAEALLPVDFLNIAQTVTLRREDFAVVMTRGHQADYEILRQLLRSELRYIGCIGSRRKIALTRDRLIAEGFTETDCARVHTPIGLPIGAQTPAEIAVSIAAEMIAVRAGLF